MLSRSRSARDCGLQGREAGRNPGRTGRTPGVDPERCRACGAGRGCSPGCMAPGEDVAVRGCAGTPGDAIGVGGGAAAEVALGDAGVGGARSASNGLEPAL